MTIPDTIIRIAENLRTQDNRITSDPIFIVQQKTRVWLGDSGDYSDTHIWVNSDWDEVYDEDKIAELNVLDENGEDIPERYYKSYYRDEWRAVQPFFTEAGAQAYIAINGHNLTEPRIYVESGWRNAEWQELREWLMSL